MKRRSILAVFSAVFLTASGAGSVSAHGAPARSESVSAGPYLVVVNQYADPARAGQGMDITVSAVPGSPSLQETSLSVIGKPAPGTDATQTRAVPLREEVPLEPGSYFATISFPVAGAWQLVLTADGPAGSGTAVVAVQVAAPTAIPFWLGWLIGLSPLVGVAWFAWWSRGYLARLRAEATVASPG
jgi:hypothetical protein